MIGWLLLVVYVVGWFFAVPATYRFAEGEFSTSDESDADRWVNACMAAILACIWPFLLIVAFVHHTAARANARDRKDVQ